MARQQFLHRLHQVIFTHSDLRLGLFLEVFGAVLDTGERRAEHQILDGQFVPLFFVGALDNRARTAAFIGIFQLLADGMFRVAEIKLGADAGIAQLRDEFLAVRDLHAGKHRDQHRPALCFAAELAERGERGLQARYADGKSGRRHRLAAKARHQTIVTSAAADRTKADWPAFVVLGFDQQFNFENRAGVIFETADDGVIDLDPVSVTASIYYRLNLLQVV